jgi:hypothetical protein
MEGELILPMLHAQYSSLPHQNTYRVDDSLETIWNDVVHSVCGQYNLRFNHRFLKNPLHFSYKFIYEVVSLIDVILPYTALVQSRASDFDAACDVETYLQFMASFTESLTVTMEKHIIETDDVQTIAILCNEITATINMTFFQKYEPLKTFLGKFLKILMQLFTELESLSASQTHLMKNKVYQINRPIITDNFQKNIVSNVGDSKADTDVDNDTDNHNANGSPEVVLLCLPCKSNGAAAYSSTASSPLPLKKPSSKKRRFVSDENDAFFKPNKHVFNGYCPCCD